MENLLLGENSKISRIMAASVYALQKLAKNSWRQIYTSKNGHL